MGVIRLPQQTGRAGGKLCILESKSVFSTRTPKATSALLAEIQSLRDLALRLQNKRGTGSESAALGCCSI